MPRARRICVARAADISDGAIQKFSKRKPRRSARAAAASKTTRNTAELFQESAACHACTQASVAW